MSGRAACAIATLLFAGCAVHASAVPSNLSFGSPRALPAPVTAPNSAPARILAMNFSSNDVHRGQTWSGRIITTTNAASVEVRTNLFSIDVPRHDFGRFAFELRVFDVPPIFVRAYLVRVIARNSAGQETEEDFPFRVR